MNVRNELIRDFIVGFTLREGYPPTQEQIAHHIGVTRQAIAKRVKKMEREGLLRRAPGTVRTTQISEANMTDPQEGM